MELIIICKRFILCHSVLNMINYEHYIRVDLLTEIDYRNYLNNLFITMTVHIKYIVFKISPEIYYYNLI